jgi:hypothetical protein
MKPIKILKKLAGSVRFQFYKPKTEKTAPNRKKTWKKTEPNRKKPSQTRSKPKKTRQIKKTEPNRKTKPNRFEPVFVLKNQTEPNRNRSVWTGFYPKKSNRAEPKPVGLNRFRFFFLIFFSVWLLFFYKNWTEPKMITPKYYDEIKVHQWLMEMY